MNFIHNSLKRSTSPDDISAFSHYAKTNIPGDVTMNNYDEVVQIYENETKRISSLNNSNDCSTIKKPAMHVISHRCQFEQRFNEFSLLRSLLRQLLQFHHNEKNQYEREQYLLHLFDITKAGDLCLGRKLFLLDDLLDVQFRRSYVETENVNDNNLIETYETNINQLLLHILNKLIESSSNVGELPTIALTERHRKNLSR